MSDHKHSLAIVEVQITVDGAEVILRCVDCGGSWAGPLTLHELPEPPEPEEVDDQGRILEPILRHGEQRGWHHHHLPHSNPLDPGHHGGILVHDSEAIGSFDDDGRVLAYTVHGMEHDEVSLGFDEGAEDPCTDPACPFAGALRLS